MHGFAIKRQRVAPHTDIALWRIQIFARLLSIVLVLGIGTAIPSIALAAREGLWPLIVVDLLAIGWLLAIWRLHRWSYRTRVLNFIAVVFFVSAGMIINVGQVAHIYLIAPPVFAAVLLGRRLALVALGISGVLLLGLSVSGHVKSHVTGTSDEFLPSLIVALNFLFIGALITVSCSTLLQKLGKSLAELHLFARSLEEGKDALDSLNAELRLTAAAVAQLNDMVLIVRATETQDQPRPIIFANDSFVRRTGYTREAVLGRSMDMFIGPGTDAAGVEGMIAAMDRGAPASGELLAYTSSGTQCWIETEIVPFVDEAGAHTHWVVVARDISERKKADTAIHQLAFFDVLTGLPNRRMLMDRLTARLQRAQDGNSLGALLYIDLDNFKFINDARGHATGDALLRSAAGRLAGLMGKDDIVARFGGDEFVVLLADLGNEVSGAHAAALLAAGQIRDTLTRPFDIDGQCYNSSASIGVTLLSHSGQTVEDVLREADTAMYRGKAGGRNGVTFFEESMQAEIQHQLALERDLAAALPAGELRMYAQLQVDANGTPTGAELLMRWRRADGTMVPPNVFIPIAEASGLIVSLGQWALRQACLGCLQLAEAGHPMPLSVNVSPSQFRQPDFVASVRAILAGTGAPPSQLIFEITEGLLIDKLDDTIGRMHELAELGIRFSIDDFGTGYSSFAYLKRMPLYELKIDKSFIHDTPADANGKAIVQSILAMAGHLGLRVVAEGVETQAQAQFLAEHGAPQMQGYLFARPMPLPDMIALLDARPATRLAALPRAADVVF
jgi:diguanylate cyclase (GGDEF)-like protein/PAS domain S-box-containing protein